MKLTGNLGLKKPEGTDVVNIDDLNQNFDILDVEVTKLATVSEAGRMSAADKVKLDGIESGAQRNTVTSVNGKTGAVTLTASDVGASPTGHTHTFAEITSKPTTLSGYGITDAIPASQKGAANGVASLDSGAKVPTTQLPNASKTQAGIVQLDDTLTSTSTTKAATANAVKQVNDTVVAHSADTAAHGIGDKSTLLTTNKNTIVEAINELFTFANDGKTQIANAITAKGVSASPTETFASLAEKIGQISTGKKWASGTINPYTPKTTITVNDLSFTPSIIIIQLRESDTTSSLYDTYYWKIYTPINKVINRWRAMGRDRDWASGSELTCETSITIQSNGFTYSKGMPGSSTPSRNTVTWWAFE